jgi:hypothetical protein
MNAMRGRIALQKKFVQNVSRSLFLFRPAIAALLECALPARLYAGVPASL